MGSFGQVGPIQRRCNSFHVNNALDALTIVSGPIDPEYGAPVVQHEHHTVAEIERVPEREQIVAVFGIAVAIRPRWAELL